VNPSTYLFLPLSFERLYLLPFQTRPAMPFLHSRELYARQIRKCYPEGIHDSHTSRPVVIGFSGISHVCCVKAELESRGKKSPVDMHLAEVENKDISVSERPLKKVLMPAFSDVNRQGLALASEHAGYLDSSLRTKNYTTRIGRCYIQSKCPTLHYCFLFHQTQLTRPPCMLHALTNGSQTSS
jgi:hypothetical protein